MQNSAHPKVYSQVLYICTVTNIDLTKVVSPQATLLFRMPGFYDIRARKIGGEVISMSDYKGKVVLIENTASLWGTTVRDFMQMNELCEKVSH